VAQTGPGKMEEVFRDNGLWRWSAIFGSYTQTRIFSGGRIFDENPAMMPLRLQMLRGAIFWPIHTRPNELLRISAGTWNGSPVMCVLGSPLTEVQNWPGRWWDETEFCVDTKSGLLQTYSVAPGLYVVYDYQNAVKFHASVLPRTITIYEGGNTVLTIHIDGIVDQLQPDPNLFVASAKAASGPSAPVIAGQFHYLAAGGESPVPIPKIQPVIVHALLNPEGKVEEAEALTADATLGPAAVALVKNSTYPAQQQGRALQREAFIDVRYVPPHAAQPGE